MKKINDNQTKKKFLHLKSNERIMETHLHEPFYVLNRKYEFSDLEHHDKISILDMVCFYNTDS